MLSFVRALVVVALGATVACEAGQWVRVFECTNNPASFVYHKTIAEINQMALYQDAKLKFTPPAGDNPALTIESIPNALAIQQLRKAIPQTMSHGGASNNIGVNSGPYDSQSQWVGAPAAKAHTGASCGWASPLATTGDFRLYWACNNGNGIHIVQDALAIGCSWGGGITEDIALDIWQPLCDIPVSEWLETAFAPELDVAGSGFTTGATDVFRFSFDYHRKYANRVFNTGAANNLETEVVDEYRPAKASLGECYDNIKLDIVWGDLVPFCARDATSDPAFVIYTCKVTAAGEEALDPIRGQGLTRVVHNEIPVYIKFPKQVSSSIGDISAFRAPDVQAAIVRQEVNVAVDTLNVVATVRLFTSVQYPFRLITPEWNTAAPTPTGISPGVTPFMFTDCTPYPQGGDTPGQPGDANACNQVWQLDLSVLGGANPANSVCQLDGQYQFKWAAECLSTFPSDCPLVQDDQGVLQNEFAITFTLDSEYFCPQVVDTVDVAATLTVFKDIAHGISASNFILGQTLYLVANVQSNKATVVGVQLDDLSYNKGNGPVAVVVDTVASTLAAPDAIQNLVWYESGSTVGAAIVPANQVWVQFLVSNPPFDAPVDGSQDFSISATLNVQFKDATVLLLQAGGSPKSQKFGATTTTSVGAGDDNTASAADVAVRAAVGAAFTAAMFA